MTAALATLNSGALVALASCEQRIERGMKTFIDVGLALAEIRDSRLYKGTHDTFEAYLEGRWGMSRAHAYRMITAAEVVSPIGDTDLPSPTNEGQARALAAVPEPERAEVWREATERTGGKPTAKVVTEIAKERTAPPAEPARKPLGTPAPEPAEVPSTPSAGSGSTPAPVADAPMPSREPDPELKPTLTLVPDLDEKRAGEQRDARALLSRGVDLLAPARWNEGHLQAWIKQLGADDEELTQLKERAAAAIAVLNRIIEEAGR